MGGVGPPVGHRADGDPHRLRAAFLGRRVVDRLWVCVRPQPLQALADDGDAADHQVAQHELERRRRVARIVIAAAAVVTACLRAGKELVVIHLVMDKLQRGEERSDQRPAENGGPAPVSSVHADSRPDHRDEQRADAHLLDAEEVLAAGDLRVGTKVVTQPKENAKEDREVVALWGVARALLAHHQAEDEDDGPDAHLRRHVDDDADDAGQAE
mmetsp:Transcript_7727/g.18047  ORF Transcript_7727/g.18047 Transcript_7727/m.18047 type:complete len:213 (+) Transcript_7727:318-956(+)